MMSTSSFLLNEIFLPTITIFFFFGSIIAIAVGVGLIFRVTATVRFFEIMNRWVSTRHALKFAEVPRDMEPVLHRRLRALGTVVVLGAAVSVYGLSQMNEISFVRLVFSELVPPMSAQVMAESAKWFLLVGNLVALLVGVAMLFFPHVLANLEAQANKWISVRQHTRGGDDMHMTVDSVVLSYPRATGCAIVIMGLYLTWNWGVMLLGRL